MALKDMKINTKDYYIWRAMVFNATFNNISVISWRSITLVFTTSTLKCAAKTICLPVGRSGTICLPVGCCFTMKIPLTRVSMLV